MNKTYIAIDFETADYKDDSACAVGLVKIVENELVDSYFSLIKPPRSKIYFSHIHGLTWKDLEHAPDFSSVFSDIQSFIDGANYFVAHNASFDKKILYGTCTANNLEVPTLPFFCTCKLSRKTLNLPHNDLKSVSNYFNINFKHHDAAEDAFACAKIFINFLNMGNVLSH